MTTRIEEAATVNGKSWLRSGWDLVGAPFRLALFDQKWLPWFGWTTLEEERLRAVLPHVRGRLLDIGAGMNNLVRRHGNGVGVDVHDWDSGLTVVPDSSKLPFESQSYDTVAIIAALNHIPNRQDTLIEARRLVRPGGRLILTMINPILGGIGHTIWWYAEDRHRGGMAEGEVGGMWPKDVVKLCETAGFQLTHHSRFVYAMNHLFVFETADTTP